MMARLTNQTIGIWWLLKGRENHLPASFQTPQVASINHDVQMGKDQSEARRFFTFVNVAGKSKNISTYIEPPRENRCSSNDFCLHSRVLYTQVHRRERSVESRTAPVDTSANLDIGEQLGITSYLILSRGLYICA